MYQVKRHILDNGKDMLLFKQVITDENIKFMKSIELVELDRILKLKNPTKLEK